MVTANIQWEQKKLYNKITKAFEGFQSRTGIIIKTVETKVNKVEILPNGDTKLDLSYVFTYSSPMAMSIEEGKVENALNKGFDTSERREQETSEESNS